MEYILYSPPNWVSVIVYDRHEAAKLVRERGYRYEAPASVEAKAAAPKAKATASPARLVPTPTPVDGAVNINTDELVAITRLGVKIAAARKVIASRPYKTIEDLIAADIAGIDWLSLYERGEIVL